MPNHFILFLNANCICSVLNKRPDHLQTRQSSVAVPTAFCCKPLHIKMVKTSWNLIKFGKTTSQWRSPQMSWTCGGFKRYFRRNIWNRKTGCQRMAAGPSEIWGNGIMAATMEEELPFSLMMGKGRDRGPLSWGRQKTWKPWKCGKKTMGGIGSSVRMFLILPCISRRFSRWSFATTVFLYLLVLLFRYCRYIHDPLRGFCHLDFLFDSCQPWNSLGS